MVGDVSLRKLNWRGEKKQHLRSANAVFVLFQCAHLGSNQGPKDYESSTLTN